MLEHRPCSCDVCRCRRRLESKLAVAGDVHAERRLFVTDADGQRIWQWQQRDIDELIAGLKEVLRRLDYLGHGRLPGARTPRRCSRRFMQCAALARFMRHAPGRVRPTDPRDRDAADTSERAGSMQWF